MTPVNEPAKLRRLTSDFGGNLEELGIEFLNKKKPEEFPEKEPTPKSENLVFF